MGTQIPRAAKSAALDIEHRDLPRSYGPEIDVQAARIVAFSRCIERHKRGEIAQVLPYCRDHHDGKRIELPTQLHSAKVVIDAVKSNNCYAANCDHRRLCVPVWRLQIATRPRGVTPSFQFSIARQRLITSCMRGV